MQLDGAALPASGPKCARCWNFMPDGFGLRHLAERVHALPGALAEMGIEPPVEATLR